MCFAMGQKFFSKIWFASQYDNFVEIRRKGIAHELHGFVHVGQRCGRHWRSGCVPVGYYLEYRSYLRAHIEILDFRLQHM